MQSRKITVIILLVIFLLLLVLFAGCTDEMVEDIKDEINREVAEEFEKAKENISRSVESKYDEVKESAQSGLSDFADEVREWISGILNEPDKPDSTEIVYPEPVPVRNESEKDSNSGAKTPFLLPEHIEEEQVKNAINWAKGYHETTWQRNVGYYGQCLLFVQHAYSNGANITIQTGYGSASYAANVLGAGKNETHVPPPPGSWVFYSVINDPRGHVALSLGDGNIIHVNTDDKKGTATVKKNHYRDEELENYGIVYIGWAWPSVLP